MSDLDSPRIILPILVVVLGIFFAALARVIAEYRQPWWGRAFGDPSPRMVRIGTILYFASGIVLLSGGAFWFAWLNLL